MNGYVLGLDEIDRTQAARVGGKGAHLGELARLDGVRVPGGFCVTTDAYRRIAAAAPSLDDRIGRLSRLAPEDHEAIRASAAEIRRIIEAVAIPDDVATAITRHLERFDEHASWAVRSSATAEDLPTASFAGQQDTYLHVVGPAAVLDHVRRCWASLFTERAVTYRQRAGVDHRTVHMAVVVQRMIVARAAGVLFTADPVTGHRKVAAIEATFGLGEAIVSGLVNADAYTVRHGEIVSRAVGTKALAIHAAPAGGTRRQPIAPERREQPALTDAEVVRLAALGRRIEAHFGRPQDIEWCLDDDGFQFVQSRPITTLFPIPDSTDGENHVFISVGHQQMMTDAMKPLGISVWQLSAARPMYEAGGRLFVDVTRELAAPASRAALLGLVGRSDPLIGDALRTLVDRGDVVPSARPADGPPPDAGAPAPAPPPPLPTDPKVVAELIAQGEASVAALRREIAGKSGLALLDFLRADFPERRRMVLEPRTLQAIMASVESYWWLTDHLQEWLGEKNAADTLAQSVPHNVTSEMGLALLDVADAIRPHPAVVAFLQRVVDAGDDGFVDALPALEGGRAARDAIVAWLDRYGMRCVGEIDITRPRWSERPSSLVPLILANVRHFESGAGPRRFAQGLREARQKEEEVLARLRSLPDGERKADETRRMIDRLRTFAGYREHPKYRMICRFFVYKQALLAEAERLVQAGVLRAAEDIYYLTFEELREVVRTQHADEALVRRREEAFRSYRALTPP
ncbi:MAG TPA: rifamycin-inactivating phosphotransferase, partial [Gemmatimonadaceae bacterium]|nr:rifamycin-inactivating phosphotransferase [Gemmatimonadaceae bacterium]